MSIIIMNKFSSYMAYTFPSICKILLHSKHLNKILFEIVNFGFLQHFSEAIKNTSSSTTKIQMIKKMQVLKQIITLHKIPTSTNIKQEINLHDMSDEDSSVVGGE